MSSSRPRVSVANVVVGVVVVVCAMLLLTDPGLFGVDDMPRPHIAVDGPIKTAVIHVEAVDGPVKKRAFGSIERHMLVEGLLTKSDNLSLRAGRERDEQLAKQLSDSAKSYQGFAQELAALFALQP